MIGAWKGEDLSCPEILMIQLKQVVWYMLLVKYSTISDIFISLAVDGVVHCYPSGSINKNHVFTSSKYELYFNFM